MRSTASQHASASSPTSSQIRHLHELLAPLPSWCASAQKYVCSDHLLTGTNWLLTYTFYSSRFRDWLLLALGRASIYPFLIWITDAALPHFRSLPRNLKRLSARKSCPLSVGVSGRAQPILGSRRKLLRRSGAGEMVRKRAQAGVTYLRRWGRPSYCREGSLWGLSCPPVIPQLRSLLAACSGSNVMMGCFLKLDIACSPSRSLGCPPYPLTSRQSPGHFCLRARANLRQPVFGVPAAPSARAG